MKTILFILALVVPFAGLAQSLQLPADQDSAKLALEKFTLFSDNFSSGSFSDAIEPLEWILKHAPGITESVYINGIKMYESFVKEERDPVAKRVLQEKIMGMYDQRIRYFEDDGNVVSRKAFAAYRFFNDDENKLRFLLDLFDKVFNSTAVAAPDGLPLAFMDVIRRYQLKYEDLTKTQILERYDRIAEVQRKKPDVEAAMQKIDKILIETAGFDCREIAEEFGLREEEHDMDKARKFLALSLTYKCTGSPEFISAARVVFNSDPGFGLAKIIALISESNGEFLEAEKYWKLAAAHTTDPGKQSEAFMALAFHYEKRDLKQLAREYALKASADDSMRSKAYRLIGDLYFNSYDECREGKSQLADRGVYLAAWEMYKKAGDNERMQAARRQFPSGEDIHAEDFYPGATIRIGCWINEDAVVQKRD